MVEARFVAAIWLPLVALLTFVGITLLLTMAWRRGRLALAFVAVATLLAATWVLAYVAAVVDFRYADGWVDCRPGCTILQDGVHAALELGPLVLFGSVLCAAILGGITWRRGRESRRRE